MGTIPAVLGQLTELNLLNLAGNRLTGIIPPEFGQLSGLISLVLNSNLLEGIIPSELVQAANLFEIKLGNNKLSGGLPAELVGLPLEVLNLEGTQLCAPPDVEFEAWLSSILDRSEVETCRP